MIYTDNLEAANLREVALADSRVKQFWDPDRILGRLLSQTLRLRISIAWDVYLIYLPDHPWDGELPPEPVSRSTSPQTLCADCIRRHSLSMTESCCCPSEAGNAVCDLPSKDFQHPVRDVNACPQCGKTGKPVEGQTVKSLLSVSLRQVQDVQYLFCRMQDCPVVYFSAQGEQTFTVDQVRERVYQKEPESEYVFACYCFGHTVGDLRTASPDDRSAIVDDINTGINAGQCACDLRNPQGSCCLGNVRKLIKRLEEQTVATT